MFSAGKSEHILWLHLYDKEKNREREFCLVVAGKSHQGSNEPCALICAAPYGTK